MLQWAAACCVLCPDARVRFSAQEEGLAFLTEDELEAEGGLEGNPDVGTMGTMGSGSSLTNNFICQASHPAVAFFHLAFKVRRRSLRGICSARSPPHASVPAPARQVAALLVYILSGWFTTGFVTPFVIIILLLAADFWTVKVRRCHVLVLRRLPQHGSLPPPPDAERLWPPPGGPALVEQDQ